MKRRAWRITIGAAALVAVLLAVLVLANWGTVRDHVEAWHFQLTRKTRTIEPPAERTAISMPSLRTRVGKADYVAYWEGLLYVAANEFRSPVIYNPEEAPSYPRLQGIVCDYRGFLARSGFRLLEQRFPRRAYVVLRVAEAIPDPPIAENFVIPLIQWRRR